MGRVCVGKVITENAGLKLLDCDVCHYAHLFPLPSGKDIAKLYGGSELYTNPENSPPDWFEQERKENEAGLWNARYDDDLKLLSGDLRLIDIGCGAGWFVKYVRDNHLYGEVFGIEPSEVARKVLNLPYIYPRWPDIPYPYTKMRASLVLEHVLHPQRVLLQWRERLCEHGRLLVIVPNEINSLRARVGNEWWVVSRHVNYFSAASLRRLMLSSGFRVVHETATMPMEIFILMGLDYRKNPALGRKLHRLRLQFETTFGAKAFSLYHALYKRFGWGGALRFVGEKV